MSIEDIAKEYGPKVSLMARRMLHNEESAKDAAQEVWMEVIKSISSFKGNSKISTWIYTIAKRTILRYAKSEKQFSFEGILKYSELGQIEYTGKAKEKEQWIKEKCDKCITGFCHCLNNDARLMFLFRECLDLPYAQISTIMEVSEPSVRKTVSRSLDKIRNFMTDNCAIYNPSATCKCRIRDQIYSINLEQKYLQWNTAERLVGFHKTIEKELPGKDYWKKMLEEVVTN